MRRVRRDGLGLVAGGESADALDCFANPAIREVREEGVAPQSQRNVNVFS